MVFLLSAENEQLNSIPNAFMKIFLFTLTLVIFHQNQLVAQELDPCKKTEVSEFDELDTVLNVGNKLRQETLKVIPQELEKIGKRLSNIHQCPEKIWPDYKLPNTPVRMMLPTEKAIYLYSSETSKFEFERETKEADHRVGSFAANTEGDGGMMINTGRYIRPTGNSAPPGGGGAPPKPSFCEAENGALNQHLRNHNTKSELTTEDKLLSFTAHENFHTVDQSPGSVIHQHSGACRWDAQVSNRSVPGNTEELALGRQHLMSVMLEAYRTPANSEERKEKMKQVKAWTEQLENKFPKEMKMLSSVDRSEGIAEYVGILTNVYGTLGCGASDRDKKELILKHLTDRYSPSVQNLDMQGYLIGALSGFLLDDESDSTWKEKTTTSQMTPLTLLRKTSTYQKTPEVEVKMIDVLETSQNLTVSVDKCKQKLIQEQLAPVFQNTEEYVLVQLDKVPFSTSGGFVSYETPTQETIVVSLASSSNGQNIKMKNQTLIKLEGLCKNGGSPNFVLVPRRLISENGQIQGDETVQVEGKVELDDSAPEWHNHSVACQP